MAVRFIDGFEGYGTTNGNAPIGMQTKYQNCSLDSTLTVQAGRTGGHCIRVINAKFLHRPQSGIKQPSPLASAFKSPVSRRPSRI